MKFVCLTSGGLDSVFACHQAVASGHELLCFASLTAACSCLLPFALAQSLSTPIVSYPFSLPFHQPALTDLLRTVKYRFPDVVAVVSGVVACDSRRQMIESACESCNLTSISPLWKGKREDIAAAERESGIEAVVIQTESRRLSIEFVGKSVWELSEYEEEMRKTLQISMERDLGEVKTAVVDFPSMKARIVIEETEVKSLGDGQSKLEIGRISLENKESGEKEEVNSSAFPISQAKLYTTFTHFQSGEVTAALFGHRDCRSTEDEAFVTMRSLVHLLESHGFRMEDIYYVHVTLQSLSDFLPFNQVYRSFFLRPNPPCRCCIETAAQSQRVKLVVRGTQHEKSALHVQSVSSWAPANIGPYSQAISSEGRLHISGNLGLVPTTMTLAPDQCRQTLENIEKVAEVCQFDFVNSELTVVFFVGEKPKLPEGFNPFYIKATKLPKDACVEVEMHMKQSLLPMKSEEVRLESEEYTAILRKKCSAEVIYGCFQVEIASCRSESALISAVRQHLDAYFRSIPHKSPTNAGELLSRQRLSNSVTDYITEVRIACVRPYAFQRDWMEIVPTSYIESESEAILIVLEDRLQLATYDFLEEDK